MITPGKADVLREYAQRWPVTYAITAALTFLGSQVLLGPLLAAVGIATIWSSGEKVGVAAVFGAVATAVARNAGPRAA